MKPYYKYSIQRNTKKAFGREFNAGSEFIFILNNKTMETTIIERIKQIIEKENIPQVEFAKMIGISPNTWKTMNSSKRKGDPKASFLEKLSEAFPHYNLTWIITGRGEMLNAPKPYLHREEIEKMAIKEPQLPYKEYSNYQLIPLFSFDTVGDIASNIQVTIENGSIIGFFPFTDAANGDIALSVFGEGMAPVLPAGSYMHLRPVKRWQKHMEFGQLYFFELEDRQYILREVHKSTQPNTFRLLSCNERFDECELPFDMIHAVWLVKAKYEKFTF